MFDFARLAGSTAAAAVLASGLASSADALTLGFDVTFTSGTLVGQSFSGEFSIDDSTLDGVGLERFNPDGDFDGDTLTGFSLTVAGASFSMEDDDPFSDYPRVAYLDGVFDHLGFMGSLATGEILDIFVDETLDIREALFIGPSGERSTGTVVGEIPSVPLPGSGVLLAAPALALFVRRRRRAA